MVNPFFLIAWRQTLSYKFNRGKRPMILLFRILRKGGLIVPLIFCFSVLVDIFSSFQYDDRLDATSDFIWSMIWAPFYGGAERVGQRDIVLVLFDETTRTQTPGMERWPPDYGVQADVVEKVVGHAPAAIFLDFYYREARADPARPARLPFQLSDAGAVAPSPVVDVGPNYRQFEDFARRLIRAAETVPLFVGPVGSARRDAVLEQLIASPSRVTPVGVDIFDDPAYVYPLTDQSGREQAALALYRVWCGDDRRCGEALSRLGEKAYDGIALEWGFGLPDQINALLTEDAKANQRCVGRTIGERVAGAVSILSDGALFELRRQSGFDAPLFRPCPYYEFIPAQWLFTPPPGVDLDKLLSGKMVLIGADLDFLADNFNVPLLGKVPGAHIHATALDNLMEYGSSVPRQPTSVVLGLDGRDVIEIALSFLAWLGLALSAEAAVRWRTRTGLVRFVTSPWFFVVLLPLGASALMTLLHWPAANVLGVSSLALVQAVLIYREVEIERAEAARE